MRQNDFDKQRDALIATAPIARFWLLGKTGSGKTSIVRYLTGATDAEIGNGFRPQTKFSQQYKFPDGDVPLVQFVDTRGLGEPGYDPADDLAAFDEKTHLLIVTVRLSDQAIGNLLAPLKTIRADNPHRPVLLVVTCLHDRYSRDANNFQHPQPDPFDALATNQFRAASLERVNREDLIEKI